MGSSWSGTTGTGPRRCVASIFLWRRQLCLPPSVPLHPERAPRVRLPSTGRMLTPHRGTIHFCTGSPGAVPVRAAGRGRAHRPRRLRRDRLRRVLGHVLEHARRQTVSCGGLLGAVPGPAREREEAGHSQGRVCVRVSGARRSTEQQPGGREGRPWVWCTFLLVAVRLSPASAIRPSGLRLRLLLLWVQPSANRHGRASGLAMIASGILHAHGTRLASRASFFLEGACPACHM